MIDIPLYLQNALVLPLWSLAQRVPGGVRLWKLGLRIAHKPDVSHRTGASPNMLRLPKTIPGPSRFTRRLCKLCDTLDWRGEDWFSILDELGLGCLRNPHWRY